MEVWGIFEFLILTKHSFTFLLLNDFIINIKSKTIGLLENLHSTVCFVILGIFEEETMAWKDLKIDKMKVRNQFKMEILEQVVYLGYNLMLKKRVLHIR